ncbi:MAG: WecB/TagA/CpsF family glycosyltransferase [Patescibacteria group bacterium]|jgi:N-acetylglucosaminyldiphosphoundecaprenol N-acetyl-beta-D-mannosaminyltransferase
MVNILGIRLDNLKPSETLSQLKAWLNETEQHYLVTPNPEIILAAQKDPELVKVINQASLSLPDGIGLILVARLAGKKLIRQTGSDLTPQVLALAMKQGSRVMILNRVDGLSSASSLKPVIQAQYPELDFKILDIERSAKLSEEIKREINDYAPAILFNTLGFPEQEKLIAYNLEFLPTVKLALAVGGSFDYLSGRIDRGPKVFRQLGLEWLWRLLNAHRFENSRARRRRIYRATIIFPLTVLRNYFSQLRTKH